MAVIIPVTAHTMSDRPTELEFSKTPFGLTKIPDPMMLPINEGTKEKLHFSELVSGVGLTTYLANP